MVLTAFGTLCAAGRSAVTALKAADYTPLTTDETILVNAGSGGTTVTLPLGATAGKRYTVKKIDTTSNTVMLDGGGGSIDGSSSVQTNTPYQGWIVQSDGTNWFVVGRM